MLPSVARVVAACVPGQRVVVVVAGQAYQLPETPPVPVVVPPDPVEVLAKQLLERDAEARAVAASTQLRVLEESQRTQELLRRTIEGQQEIVSTLMLPVVPTGYDKTGRITSAQRKKD